MTINLSEQLKWESSTGQTYLVSGGRDEVWNLKRGGNCERPSDSLEYGAAIDPMSLFIGAQQGSREDLKSATIPSPYEHFYRSISSLLIPGAKLELRA